MKTVQSPLGARDGSVGQQPGEARRWANEDQSNGAVARGSQGQPNDAIAQSSQVQPGGAPHAGVVARDQSPEERLQALRHLPDDRLTQQVRTLSEHKHALDAELLLCLSELDRRKLYREHACSSLFTFCVQRLGFSEDAAYKRVGVARMLRQYPLVFALLSEGRIHLSALMLIKPHLTQHNHCEWLMAASGKSKRDVEKLVASRHPRSDVATRIRKLPDAGLVVNETAAVAAEVATVATETANASGAAAAIVEGGLALDAGSAAKVVASDVARTQTSRQLEALPVTAPGAVSGGTSDKPSFRTKLEPLSGRSYRVVFTANERLKQKMDRARELLSHTVPPSDFPALLDRALGLLIERAECRRFGSKRAGKRTPEPACAGGELVPGERATSSELAPGQADVETGDSGTDGELAPGLVGHADSDEIDLLGDLSLGQPVAGTARCEHSRHVPVAVARDVWTRDAGRCTYVDRDGNRCEERHFLQLDHREAHGLGGPPTRENLRLRCAVHNALGAEQVYGGEQMESVIEASRARRRR